MSSLQATRHGRQGPNQALLENLQRSKMGRQDPNPPLSRPPEMAEYGVRVLANQVSLSNRHKMRAGINTTFPDRTPPALNKAQCKLQFTSINSTFRFG